MDKRTKQSLYLNSFHFARTTIFFENLLIVSLESNIHYKFRDNLYSFSDRGTAMIFFGEVQEMTGFR